MTDKFGWDSNFGNNPAPTRHQNALKQTCKCGHGLGEHVRGGWECLAVECKDGCVKFRAQEG